MFPSLLSFVPKTPFNSRGRVMFPSLLSLIIGWLALIYTRTHVPCMFDTLASFLTCEHMTRSDRRTCHVS